MFVDATGRRRRWLRLTGYAVAVVCFVYAAVLVISLIVGPITPLRGVS